MSNGYSCAEPPTPAQWGTLQAGPHAKTTVPLATGAAGARIAGEGLGPWPVRVDQAVPAVRRAAVVSESYAGLTLERYAQLRRQVDDADEPAGDAPVGPPGR